MANVITSDAFLRRIKPPAEGRIDYRDKNTGGLSLRVSNTGRMVWLLRARLNGKQQRFEIGHYTDSESGLVLAAAREKAELWKSRIRAGDDPRQAERDRKLDTFAEVRKRFFKEHVERTLKTNTLLAYKAALESSRFIHWNDRPVYNITSDDVLNVIDGIADDGKLIQANRTFSYLKKFFNWCAEKRIIKAGEPVPTDRLKRPLKKEQARKRFLSDPNESSLDEIRLFWLATAELGYPYKQAYRLFLTTGQRKTECATLQRKYVKGGQWFQGDNKAGREHIVPLNELALAELKECPNLCNYYFTTTAEGPINGFSKSKARLDRLMSVKAAELGLEPVKHWTIHDLRRTMVSHLRKAGISLDICSALLNHAEKGVTAEHYSIYDMLDEKGHAMKVWNSLLTDFIHGKADNVVSLLDKKRS